MYQPEGNYFDKYGSKNLVVRKIMRGFFNGIHATLCPPPKKQLSILNECKSILDAGCGEGNVTNYMRNIEKDAVIDAFDISEKVIAEAKNNFSGINFFTGSMYDIPKEDKTYDLVMSSEVLEHMDNPETALRELMRVSKKYIFISVPREPLWCVLNLARGKYITSWGNTPGHVNHWGKNELIRWINSVSDEWLVVNVNNPLPWTMVLLQRKSSRG